MAIGEWGPGGATQRRVKNILFSPSEEWDRIETEPATVKGLYVGYACVLAAIWPIAGFIGGQVFGDHSVNGLGLPEVFHPALIPSLFGAIALYLLNLAGLYVLGLAIDAMAPSFGGTRDPIQALKVATYSLTAAWIFAVFQLVPMVSSLSIIGVYSLYLLYLGVPKLMKAPADKALIYSIVAIAVAIAVWLVVAVVAAAIVKSA